MGVIKTGEGESKNNLKTCALKLKYYLMTQSKLEQFRTLHIMNTSPNHPTSVDLALGISALDISPENI